MSLTDMIARGREAAQARFLDTCRIDRPGDGKPTFDPSTGQYTDPAPVTVYQGACNIPLGGGAITKNGAGEQAFGVGEFPLDLPVDGTGYSAGEIIKPGQTVTYLTAPNNPTFEGMVFGVVDELLQSAPLYRRFKIRTAVSQ